MQPFGEADDIRGIIGWLWAMIETGASRFALRNIS